MRTSLLAALLSVFVMGFRAAAQPTVPDPFFKATFEEARAEAKATHRLHLIFLDNGDPRQAQAAARLWGNRSLGQWIQWHAVLSRVSLHERPDLFESYEARLKRRGWHPRARLIVVIERDGCEECIVPFFPGRATAKPWEREAERMQIKGPEVLFQANLVLDELAARSPVWHALHVRDNPPPPAPPRIWYSAIADANASACLGPGEGKSVFTMLTEARAQVARNEIHEATGTYTWLWELMDDGRVWLRPLRRTVVATEMSKLGWKRKGSRERFLAMRDDHVARDAWADLPEQFDRYLMDELVGEIEQSLMEMSYSLKDEDEGSLIPFHQRVGLELIALCIPMLEPLGQTAELERRVVSLGRPFPKPPQSLATDEEWSQLVELRRQVLMTDVCRLHAEFLRRGRDSDAMRIASEILDGDAGGTCRLALAAVAWGESVADARHVAWVKEAVALGADDAGLGEAIVRTIVDRGGRGASE